ncbi:hypothetical protein F5Y02DRAFT_422008 [Annulohypoxylon stygium]|nr:hypothetical protein F5Y02DRAFT_422008 [Annulohypoxylon stygium]
MDSEDNREPPQAPPSRPPSPAYSSPALSLTQSTMSRATTVTENEASASASSRTTYQQSLSEGTQTDNLVMPFISAPRNSPVSQGEQTAREAEYEESFHDAGHTIERILGNYASRSSMANLDSSPSDHPTPDHPLRRKQTHGNLAYTSFSSPGLPNTPDTRKGPSRGHKRSKQVLSISPSRRPIDTPAPNQPVLVLKAGNEGSTYTTGESLRKLPDPPFRYDTPQELSPFVTMRPSKGHEVSGSLRHVGKLQPGSSATLVSPQGENSPDTGTSASHLPSTSAYMDLRSHADNGMEQHDRSYGNSDWHTVRDSAETSEWCTTMGVNSEAGFNSRADPSRGDIINETGSSVAASSNLGEQNPSFRPVNFRSRPRLLQHPAAKDQNEEYEMHYMTGSNKPLLLPKVQRSVTEGYEDSSRSLASPKTENSVFSSAIRKVSAANPFLRHDSPRHNLSPEEKTVPINFTGRRRYEFRDSMTTLATQTQSARISNAITEKSTEGADVNPNAEDPATVKQSDSGHLSTGQSSSKRVEVSPTKPEDIRFVDIDYPHRPKRIRQPIKGCGDDTLVESTSQAQLMTSKSKFNFELIPLDEAQRLNKKKRETGETDETESSLERKQRLEHSDSIRLVPMTPAHMPEPTKRSKNQDQERDVAPRLSIDFSPSSVFYRDALRDITPPFSATTPNIAQPRPARLRAMSAADHEASPSPAAERSWMERVKARAIAQRNAVQRRFTELTTIHHEPVDDDSQLSLEGIEAATEPFMSGAGRARRHRIFVAAAVVSAIFPFVAILVMGGMLRGVLQWYTHGEVTRLTIYQHNYIRNTFLIWLCAIVIITPTLVAVFSKRS